MSIHRIILYLQVYTLHEALDRILADDSVDDQYNVYIEPPDVENCSSDQDSGNEDDFVINPDHLGRGILNVNVIIDGDQAIPKEEIIPIRGARKYTPKGKGSSRRNSCLHL